MSSPERKEIHMVEVPAMYGTREVPVEVIVNKGRLPKAERTLTRRERKELKNSTLDSQKVENLFEKQGELYEGQMFTFSPKK